jgi:DNA-binding transcriptional ArsR family regulator
MTLGRHLQTIWIVGESTRIGTVIKLVCPRKKTLAKFVLMNKNNSQKEKLGRNNLLNSLITSKTRVKILLKFFMNPETSAHLRGLATEFDESTNGVRVELNRLSEAGLLESSQSGNKIYYQANTKHGLYPEINSIVRKYLGIDQ